MKQASDIFSSQQRQQVEQAITEAESGTSCEIVPVVASASGRYDRAEDIIGLWMAVIAAAAVWLMFPRSLNETGSWSATPLYVGLIVMVAAVIIAFVVGAIAGSRIDWLRRLFVSRQEMQETVAARASQVFFDKRVHHTEGATGLLIYVSLMESTAVVLGDQTVLEKFGQKFLDDLCQMLTQAMRQSHPADALCQVISHAGAQLSIELPRSSTDVNEIQDALVLID